MDDFEITNEIIEKTVEDLAELFRSLGEVIGKALDEVVERLKELLSDKDSPIYRERPKYKPVKSLIKPYKQPFIKVRYRARANL